MKNANLNTKEAAKVAELIQSGSDPIDLCRQAETDEEKFFWWCKHQEEIGIEDQQGHKGPKRPARKRR